MASGSARLFALGWELIVAGGILELLRSVKGLEYDPIDETKKSCDAADVIDLDMDGGSGDEIDEEEEVDEPKPTWHPQPLLISAPAPSQNL
jgi:hypothetical protein